MKTSNFFKLSRVAPLAAVALMLAGCLPEKILWSPDCQTAAVIADSGLYLCDANGKPSGLLVPGAEAAGWFPDSRRLALSVTVKYSTWNELYPHLNGYDRDRIAVAAQTALASLRAGKTVDETADELKGCGSGEIGAVALFIKGVADAKELLGTNWADIEKMQSGYSALQLAEVSGGKVILGAVLTNELDGIEQIRVAPGGQAVAYVVNSGDDARGGLLKVALTNQSTALVASQVAANPDWSADGRALVYIKAVGVVTEKDQLRLASLCRCAVLNDAGALAIQPKPDEMVGLLFDEWAKVRCLADGRILFSSADVHFPALSSGMPQRQQLYALDASNPPALTALIPPDAQKSVPATVSDFEVSPDGRRVSIPGGDGDKLVVLDISSGAVEQIPGAATQDLLTAPVWRNNDELCFVAAPAANTNAAADASKNILLPQAALWNRGGPGAVAGDTRVTRLISAAWPADMRKNVLDK